MLVSGNTFVTVKQGSLYKVITQEVELNSPPAYLTTDWEVAKKSIIKLNPTIIVTGPGQPMGGKELADGLIKLVNEFAQIKIPNYGHSVDKEQ